MSLCNAPINTGNRAIHSGKTSPDDCTSLCVRFPILKCTLMKKSLPVHKTAPQCSNSQLPPTLSVACEGKTTDKVLRLALKMFILSVPLTDLVGSLKVWGLRPHTPPLTMSVAQAKESNYLCIGATSEPLFMVIILIFRRHVSRKEEV